MIPEIGNIALIMALCLALLQGVVPLLGAQRRFPEWMAVAVPAAQAQFLFLLISFASLTYAFVVKDFSVSYVAMNSNAALPLVYRISAVWGAHEGSLLLWALILGGWTLAVAHLSRGMPVEFSARVLAVMGLISVGFLLFLLVTSNPFDRLVPAPLEGRDLNPLLQDVGLILHPPLLYMGYVGMAVPFSFAVAALLEGRIDAAWTRWTRPWTTVAWTFLTLGIVLGSWWAYYELGWGGWWFWDPVENASFMPWLVATGLIHSLAVTEKRAAFRAWTVLLAIFGFSLSLLGTFLVRSGVLVSVHAFASDPARGVFVLTFLAIVVGGALALFAWRATRLTGAGTFRLVSRETFLLVNNVLLVVACATILLGTLYPLLMDGLGLGKISVGPPYFNAVFVPLMLPLLLVLGIGPLARWKKDSSTALAKRLTITLVASAILGAVVVALIRAPGSVMVAVSIALAVWILISTGQGVAARLEHKRARWRALFGLPRAFVGMSLAHVGIAVLVVGVTIASAYSVEEDVRMRPGDMEEIAGYQFRFDGVTDVPGPNYKAQRGTITVSRGDTVVATLRPEKRAYPIQSQPMTEAGIEPGIFRDLYVALGDSLDDGAWTLRLYYKPFIRWIWLGPLLMAIGGLLAASDRRYRLRARARAAPATAKAPDLTGAVAGGTVS